MALESLRGVGGNNPGAPDGLTQMPEAQPSILGGLAEKYGTSEPRWQTGGQGGSTKNGWQTDFYDRMFKQRDDFVNRNDMANWYGDKSFTGIATWDQKTQSRDVKFGDIYDKGRRVGNILDGQSGYSQEEAYTILGDLMLDKNTRENVYKDLAIDPKALQKEIKAKYEQTNREMQAAQGAAEFKGDVNKLKDDWNDGDTATAATVAGAAGGAILGGAIGSVVPIAGTAVGGLIGGALGALGGFLNRDSLEDQAARATVQTNMAREQFGELGGLSTGLRQWGGVALSAASPLTNLTHGLADTLAPGQKQGDGKVGWYEMEKDAGLTGLGLAATLGDSLLQFASAPGRALYLGATGATVAGGVGQLTSQGGAMFDDRRGNFHAPENVGQWASAVGAVGIDAVQMVGARGIGRAAAQSDNIVTDGVQHLAGREFTLSAGRVTNVRASTQILAPSEAVQWASVRVQANVMRAKAAGDVSKDDFSQMLFTAAQDLSRGTNLSKTAFVNAFGEGTEEGIQAVLEPLSHGWQPKFEDVFQSYLYGAAAGAGMSMGARANRQSQDTKDFTRANLAAGMQGMPQYTKETWGKLTTEQKANARTLPPIVEKDLAKAASRVAQSQVQEVVSFQAGVDKLADAQVAARDAELVNMNPALEGTYRIGQVQSVDTPNHVVQSSLGTVMNMLQANVDGLKLRLQDPTTTDPAEIAEVNKVLEAHDVLGAQLTPLLQQVEATTSREELNDVVGQINQLLQDAWNSTNAQGGAMAKAVGVVLSRSPNNSDGSFQMLLPQVLPEATELNQNGLLQVSQAILKAIDGDWDGDTMKQHAAMRPVQFRNDVASDMLWRSMRLGQNFLSTADGTPKIGVRDYEAAEIQALAMDLSFGTQVEIDNAKATVTNFSTWMRTAFSRVPNIASVVNAFTEEITAGNGDAKEVLLRTLATEHADVMLEIAQSGVPGYLTPMSNPYLAIDQQLNVALQAYQQSTAAARTGDDINLHSNPAPLVQGTPMAERVAMSAATYGATLQQAVVGTDAFRAFQHLHYAVYRSPVEAGKQGVATELDSMIALYERVNAGMRVSAREELATHDEIGQKAMRALVAYTREFNLDPRATFLNAGAVAGLQVPRYERDDQAGFKAVGGFQSMAQLILQEVATQVEADHRADGTWEGDANLQSEVLGLRTIEPGDAWFRILGDVRMHMLTDQTANAFAANLTANQVRADYLNKSALARADYRDRVKMDIRYALSEHHDLPYPMEAVENGDANAYSIFADALFESADQELSFDPKAGKAHGKAVDRDNRMQKTVEESLKTARLTVQRLAKELYKNRQLKIDGKLSYANLAKIIDQNPDFARSLVNLLPDNITNVVLTTRPNGQVGVQRWFLEMLVEESPAQQAMLYFRGLLIAQVNSMNAEANPRDSDDRLVRLIVSLRTEPARLLELQKQLFQATSVDAFMKWVNITHQTGAPQLAWYRDTAQYDSSETKGGWSRQLPGAELRESITKFANESRRFGAFAEKEIDQDVQDNALIERVRQALAQKALGRDTDAEPLLKNLKQRLDEAGKIYQGLGPQAMRMAPLAAALGFFGSATDKGKAADLYAQLAHDAARSETLHQETGYEQVTALLTSHDADSVAQNPQTLGQRNIRMMDHEGRTIEWTAPSLEQFVELWADPETRPALRAILFPSTWEIQPTGSLAQQHLTGTSLMDLVSGKTYERILAGQDFAADMQYASIVDSLSRKHGTTYAMQRRVADIVTARTNAARWELSAEDLESMVDDAYREYTAAVRIAAEFRGDPKIAEAVNAALDTLANQHTTGTTDPLQSEQIKKMLLATVDQEANPTTPEEVEFFDRRAEALQAFFSTNTFERLVREYTINWDDPGDVLVKKKLLTQTIHDNPSYVEAVASRPEIAMLRSLSLKDVTGQVLVLHPNEQEDQKLWDAVAQQVVSVVFDTVSTTASTTVPSALAAKNMTAKLIRATDDTLDRNALGNARYWDSSYRYLVDDLLNPDSAIIQAAEEFKQIVQGADVAAPAHDIREFAGAIQRLLDPEKYGPWTSDIARLSVDAQNRIDSSGAGRQVASSGISYAKQAALAKATTRSYRDPGATAAATYQIDTPQLTGLLDGTGDIFAPASLQGPRPASLSLLNGRFVTEVTLTYTESNGTRQQVDLLTAQVPAAQSFQGDGATRALPYKATTLDLLKASIGSVLPEDSGNILLQVSFFHPADQPAEPEFANNLFFEGTAMHASGDHYSSLISALWLSDGGLNVFDQAAALKANKKGLLSLINPDLVGQEVITRLEDPADMYGTLERKLALFMQYSLGHKVLEPIYANAVFKDLKMRHGLRVTVGGVTTLLSADEAIAMQKSGPIQADEIELITLSPRVLRTLLGEQDVQGVVRPWTAVPTVNSEGVTTWANNLNELALERMPGLLEAAPLDQTAAIKGTKIGRRGALQQSSVRPALTREQRGKYTARAATWEAKAQDVDLSRFRNSAFKDRLGQMRTDGLAMINADTTILSDMGHFAMRGMGLSIDLPLGLDVATDPLTNNLAYAKFTEAIAFRDTSTVWVYSHDGTVRGERRTGVLSNLSQFNDPGDHDSKAFSVVRGDGLVVRLDSFAGITDPAERLAAATAVINEATSRGVHVALVTGNPKHVDKDLRYQLGSVMTARGYESVAGAPGIYTPLQADGVGHRTLEARLSRLTEVRNLSSNSNVVVFQAKRGVAIEENAAYVNNMAQKQGREVAAVRDLAPTMPWSGFNTAVTEAQVELVRRTLSAYQANDKLEHLLQVTEQVTPTKQKLFSRDKDHAARKEELAAALNRALMNLGENGLPRVGTEFAPGDIIALVGPQNQVILYRHGYEPIKSTEMLTTMLGIPQAGDTEPANIAIYGATPLQDATTHVGKIMSWDTTPGYGLVLNESVPLQSLGNKTVLERNGMKLIGISLTGSGVELPKFGPLSRWDIDYVISRTDSLSKENFDGVIDTARDAIGYLGLDLVPVYAQTLLGIPRAEWDAASPQARQIIQRDVQSLMTAVGRRETLPVHTIDQMQRTLFGVDPTADATLQTILATAAESSPNLSTHLATTERDSWTPEDQITAAALLYMQSAGADARHILGAAGFGPEVKNGTYQSFLPPELFTSVFDRAPLGSPLRTWFFDQMNTQLENQQAAPGEVQTGYSLAQDWTFTIHNEDPSKNLEGWLQFSEAHSTGDNPILSGMSLDRNTKQNVSRQQTLVAEQSLGADFAKAKSLKKTRRFVERQGITDVTTAADLFQLMNGGNNQAGPKHSRTLSAASLLALSKGREAVRGFRQPLNQEKWDAAQIANYEKRVAEIIATLGLNENYAHLVDGWVRQWAVAPKDAVATSTASEGWVTATHAMESLQSIQQNISNNLFPTQGSKLPFLTLNETTLLAQAALEGRGNWKPDGLELEEDFYYAVLGLTTNEFDPAFAQAADGFLQSFRAAGQDFVSMPLRANALKELDLLDPATNELVLTWNQNKALGLQDPVIVDSYNALLTDLFDGQSFQSPLVRSNQKLMKWRRDTDQAIPVQQSLKDYRAQGARFVTQGTTTNSLMRILTDLRAANGMFNPWLYAVAPLEMGIRNVLENVSSVLTGDGTSGLGARLSTSFDQELVPAAKSLYSSLGRNQGFKGMMYRELVQIPALHNANRVERFTNMLARVGGSWQDPSYGMIQSTMARRYTEAVLRHVVSTGSQTNLTPRRVIEMLAQDPQAIAKAYPEAHRSAMNTIANIRSLKPTMATLVYKGFLDPLKSNPNLFINIPAGLTNITTLFLPYAFNVATNMLGLQGLNAMTAVLASGKGGKKMGKMQAWLQGVTYDPNVHGIDFTAETLEGVNLADAFIRSGMTHTSLMGLAMLTGGLGLSGEDEEEKRRRRAEEFAGVGHVYDPRDIANDFRNADALFFDNLPEWVPFAGAIKEWFEVTGPDAPGGATSMANLHWTLKQFISPLMGIERFMDTGDFRQVIWGFEDALGSMPLINASLWDESAQVSAELAANAASSQASGNAEAMAESYGFLLNGVMTLERMLFENAFVNSLYQSIDKYDRDPWSVVDLNTDGTIARDNLGTPMDTQALQQYLNEDGNVAKSDVGYSANEVQMRRLGESRMTFALFGSLFTGFDGKDSLWRYDQAVKTRKVEKNDLSLDEASELILSMWDPKSNREVLTTQGAAALMKGLHMQTIKPGDPALENVFIPYEDRVKISDYFLSTMKQSYLDAGMDEKTAQKTAKDVYFGNTNPYAKSLYDVIWSKGEFEGAIPFDSANVYRQLNTTYVMGPDGMPWATGVGRNTLMNFWGQAPLQRFNTVGDGGGSLGVDDRLNVTDATANLNTGMRNLERVDRTFANPTEEDILKAIEKGFKDLEAAVREPSWSERGGGGGYSRGGYSRGGYSRGGGGGGYSGGGGGYAYKLNGPERNNSTYGSNDPYIRVDNPIIRRASIRRERFSSTRGRLNQWQ